VDDIEYFVRGDVLRPIKIVASGMQMYRQYLCSALMPCFCGHAQAVAATPVDAVDGAGAPPGQQGGLGVAIGATPLQPPLGPINAWRGGSPSTAVASDTEDSEEEDSEEEEGSDDDVVVVEPGSGTGAMGGDRKRKATGRFQWSKKKGQTPNRAHAIVGMACVKGDPVKLWRAAVMEGWRETFPGEPLPGTLNIDKAEDVNKITHLVASMVPRTAQDRFDSAALRNQLFKNGGKLFPSRDFLQLRLKYSTAVYLTLKDGLMYAMARAIGVDERDILSKENLKKWHERPRLFFD
jgi:hypothetical protein